MKITFEVPDEFAACSITIVYFKSKGKAEIYSATRSRDSFKDGYSNCLPMTYYEGGEINE